MADETNSQGREFHPAFEEYSVAIFELEEDGIGVIQARIVERLGVSRPAVSEMIRRMTAAQLVAVDANGTVSLLEQGRQIATSVVRRHRLAERMLTDVLGLSWADAHHEAGRWEHVISPAVEAAMIRLLDDPTTCPHGNPIPGADFQPNASATSLSEMAEGDGFVVYRVPEAIEFADGELEFLERYGLIPGSSASVVHQHTDGATTVRVGEQETRVGASTAHHLEVLPQ